MTALPLPNEALAVKVSVGGVPVCDPVLVYRVEDLREGMSAQIRAPRIIRLTLKRSSSGRAGP